MGTIVVIPKRTLECEALLRDCQPSIRDGFRYWPFTVRHRHIQKFGYAILTADIIDKLRAYGPFVEVGCGTGYWSYELSRAGIEIAATDPLPPKSGLNHYALAEEWIGIEQLTADEAVAKYPTRNLLMVWPEYDANWSDRVLDKFTGDIVVYVGEGPGGCTGSYRMHSLFASDYVEIDSLYIPQFDGMHDWLIVLQRKDAKKYQPQGELDV